MALPHTRKPIQLVATVTMLQRRIKNNPAGKRGQALVYYLGLRTTDPTSTPPLTQDG